MTEAQKRKQEKMGTIREMYLSGSSREEIAEAAGYNVSTVSLYLSSMGLLHRPTKKEKENEIIRLSDGGKKLAEISREVGLAEGTVSRILRVNGRGRRTGSGKKEPDGLIDENTVFAVNKPRIYFWNDSRSGKHYIDETELYLPR